MLLPSSSFPCLLILDKFYLRKNLMGEIVLIFSVQEAKNERSYFKRHEVLPAWNFYTAFDCDLSKLEICSIDSSMDEPITWFFIA